MRENSLSNPMLARTTRESRGAVSCSRCAPTFFAASFPAYAYASRSQVALGNVPFSEVALRHPRNAESELRRSLLLHAIAKCNFADKRVPKCNLGTREREALFPSHTNRKPSVETDTDLIVCHPELAKDLTTRQPVSYRHLPFSKLTAPPDGPIAPMTRRLKGMRVRPREILRKLRMTALGASRALLRPVRKPLVQHNP